ncbi:MAG: recombinase family protein [Chloroflexi bacterium]|nr:recombinase family protein [Chloroflexota bacterium]
MTKRAILYARVSGDDTKYATSGIESQLGDCRTYAQKQGYAIVGEHFETPEKATSGADWLPEIEALLKLACTGTFDVLVVREVDRLARNRFKQMSIENALTQQGIQVEYVIGQYKDTAEGRLLKGLMSDFAEYEREKTLERTKRGSVRSVAAGNVIIGGSNAPFGYDVVLKEGKRTLEVNEREAIIVRLIFRLYAYEGKALLSICRYLDECNVPTPTKGHNHKARRRRQGWSTGTLSGILNNETYLGRWYYQKTRNVKGRDGKLRQVERPRSEWLLIEVPALINEETFSLVERRRKKNKRVREKKGSYPYPLGSIMKCGHCGSGMVGITRKYKATPHRYYRCSTRHLSARYERTCDMPTLRTDAIEPIIWQWVQAFLLNPTRLYEAWKQHEQQRLNELQPLVSMIKSNEARLAELQLEKQRLIKAYTAGTLTLDDIAVEKTRVEKQIADLTQANAELQADLQPRIPNAKEIETIEKYAQQIRQGADLTSNDPAEQREIYRLLHMEVTLTYEPAKEEGEEGQYWADLRCILGQERLSTTYTINHQNGTAPGIPRVVLPAPVPNVLVTAESPHRVVSAKNVFVIVAP